MVSLELIFYEKTSILQELTFLYAGISRNFEKDEGVMRVGVMGVGGGCLGVAGFRDKSTPLYVLNKVLICIEKNTRYS